MRNLAAILVLAAGCSLTACSMFTAWKSIPPPGGCNECHTVEISANWKVLYQPVALSDERGSLPFQHPQYVMPGRADRGRLRQLLHNLLTNAVEALEGQPGGAITVATRLAERNGEEVAEVCVEDNGPGFTREMMGRVFDPYVTTKPRGTGLGLAIVRKIVEEHGGHVEADNRSGGGARVRIELPMNETGKARAAQREPRWAESRKERA